MIRTSPSRRVKPSEEGYILVAVMFMIALLIISMAVALPKVAADIQRDRELETYHRGMQYRRAIQLYFKKFQRYPPNMEALIKTNEIRFLRKKYIDPTTGKDDWKPILFGQNKTPMAMGFFGQPLGGIGFGGGMMAGTGPAGGNGIAGANPIGGSTFGSSNSMGSSFGSTNTMGGSTFGSSNTIGGSTFGSTNTIGGSSTTNQTGATDANGNPTDPNSGSNIGTPAGNQASGPVFGGGAGMIGVSPASEKESIFVYKKKNHYNEWEFLYSYQSDMGMMGMMPPPGIQPSTPGVGAPGTTFSPTGGTGAAPAPTQPAPTQPTPTQPQQ
jgi:type II secretory pathway pseudopilin PulG